MFIHLGIHNKEMGAITMSTSFTPLLLSLSNDDVHSTSSTKQLASFFGCCHKNLSPVDWNLQ